jgi:hypothetical protein
MPSGTDGIAAGVKPGASCANSDSRIAVAITQRQRRWRIGIVGDEPEPVAEPKQRHCSHQANEATPSIKVDVGYEQIDHGRSCECGQASNTSNEAYPDATEPTNRPAKPGVLLIHGVSSVIRG